MDHELDFSNENLGDEKLINILETNQYITRLDVSENALSSRSAIEISKISSLKELNIADNLIGNNGMTAIATKLNLTALKADGNFSYDPLDEDINCTSIEILAKSPTLQELNLSNCNKCGDKGLTNFMFNHVIKELRLIECSITDIGAKYLSLNNSILDLRIAMNKIGDDGAKELAKNNTIETLDLRGNNIGNAGAMAFLNNKVLQSLSLSGNKIDKQVEELVMNHIKSNVN